MDDDFFDHSRAVQVINNHDCLKNFHPALEGADSVNSRLSPKIIYLKFFIESLKLYIGFIVVWFIICIVNYCDPTNISSMYTFMGEKGSSNYCLYIYLLLIQNKSFIISS